MPGPELPPYERALRGARAQIEGQLFPEALDRFYDQYALVLNDLFRDGPPRLSRPDGALSVQEANLLRRRLRARLAGDANQTARRLALATGEMADVLGQAHRQGLVETARSTGRTLSTRALDQVTHLNAGDIARASLARRGLPGTFTDVVHAGLGRRTRAVDELLDYAVASGRPWEAVRDEVIGELLRGEPELARAVARLQRSEQATPALRRLNLRRVRSGTATTGGAEGRRARRALRRVLADERRVVVTELSASAYETQRLACVQSPAVDLVRYQVSGRHFSLASSPDICTFYFEADLHGFGPGLYDPASVPAHPHPHCGCGLEPVFRPPERWEDPPRPLPEPPRVREPEVRRVLQQARREVRAEAKRPLTDTFIRRTTQTANRGTQAATREARHLLDHRPELGEGRLLFSRPPDSEPDGQPGGQAPEPPEPGAAGTPPPQRTPESVADETLAAMEVSARQFDAQLSTYLELRARALRQIEQLKQQGAGALDELAERRVLLEQLEEAIENLRGEQHFAVQNALFAPFDASAAPRDPIYAQPYLVVGNPDHARVGLAGVNIALSFINRVLAHQAGVRGRVIDVEVHPRGYRGHATADTISTPFDQGPWVTVHEFGHVWESASATAHNRAVAFLVERFRATDGRLERLQGDWHEWGFPDEFFAPGGVPYAGKIYNNLVLEHLLQGVPLDRLSKERLIALIEDPAETTGTELLSMGLERLFLDPVGFLEGDPEYLRFLLTLLLEEAYP